MCPRSKSLEIYEAEKGDGCSEKKESVLIHFCGSWKWPTGMTLCLPMMRLGEDEEKKRSNKWLNSDSRTGSQSLLQVSQANRAHFQPAHNNLSKVKQSKFQKKFKPSGRYALGNDGQEVDTNDGHGDGIEVEVDSISIWKRCLWFRGNDSLVELAGISDISHWPVLLCTHRSTGCASTCTTTGSVIVSKLYHVDLSSWISINYTQPNSTEKFTFKSAKSPLCFSEPSKSASKKVNNVISKKKPIPTKRGESVHVYQSW